MSFDMWWWFLYDCRYTAKSTNWNKNHRDDLFNGSRNCTYTPLWAPKKKYIYFMTTRNARWISFVKLKEDPHKSVEHSALMIFDVIASRWSARRKFWMLMFSYHRRKSWIDDISVRSLKTLRNFKRKFPQFHFFFLFRAQQKALFLRLITRQATKIKVFKNVTLRLLMFVVNR